MGSWSLAYPSTWTSYPGTQKVCKVVFNLLPLEVSHKERCAYWFLHLVLTFSGTISETDIPLTAPAKYAYGVYARQPRRPQQPVRLAASRDVQRCGSMSRALACGSLDVAVTADRDRCGVPSAPPLARGPAPRQRL